MKQTKEVEVPAKTIVRKATKKVVTTYTCDICTKPVDKSHDNSYGSGDSSCSSCGRDLCRNGISPNQTWPKSCWDTHPEDFGDYPRKMCKICLSLYYKLMQPLLNRHEQEEEDMEKRIKKESLDVKASNV